MRIKKTYYLLFTLYLISNLVSFYINFQRHDMQAFLMGFASLGLLLALPLFFKIKKFEPVYEIYILVLIFVAMASLLGSTYRFYKIFPYWDKLTHAYSGVLGCEFAYILFNVFRHHEIKPKDTPFMFVFVNALNIAIAALWEQYEYLCLLIADYDAIHHYSSGVHDSMGDIGVCIIAGLMVSFFMVKFHQSGRPNFFTNVYYCFYQKNILK